ncbi:hypothetical protein Ade02nite_96400 [Paractinoplanes deccanensis]|uniref:DUF5666 domain-containing protein n=1 Tax=Paractinoplanes deccanensis TaxID=113561 RepID=A0ABQ3YLX6_9ACTN|nr:hypothetical protein [Actinoplanes deccanensis]GID80999.1 hypothetical protein Ade02nite_96400 [Actinoplanes deccanensis]
MTRSRITVAIAGLGLAGLLALTGCGAPAAAADVADETYALTAVGMDAPEPSPSPSEKAKGKHKAARAYLRKNTLHGEIVVQGKDGTRTVVVQRGTVTATADGTLTVKSTDGFTQTWTEDENVTVRGDLKTGAEVGVAGRKEAGKPIAHLVVVKKK